MSATKVAVKLENIHIYEVDTTDPNDVVQSVDYDTIEAANDKFIQTEVIPVLNQNALCHCRMQEISQRAKQTKNLLLGSQVQIQPSVEQKDIDTMLFYVIIQSDHGYYRKVCNIVCNCTICGWMRIIGDAAPVARLLAELNANYPLAAHNHDMSVTLQDGEEIGDDYDKSTDEAGETAPDTE